MQDPNYAMSRAISREQYFPGFAHVSPGGVPALFANGMAVLVDASTPTLTEIDHPRV